MNFTECRKAFWMHVFLLSIAAATVDLFAMSPTTYPPTIKIPVTFYDFHSDSSNPEFEIAPSSGTAIRRGMVQNTLDAEKKPIVGDSIYYNYRIDRWFRERAKGSKDSLIFNYAAQNAARFQRYAGYPDGWTKINHDTSFINIKIEDSLEFVLVNAQTGTYEFRDTAFFPLDDTGFGKEGRSHNYSFAMELHWNFTKTPGLQFQFSGDDDVWAFVNNQLRMDLGGIHSAQNGSINLDQQAGLTDYTEYAFDLFYVERHITKSTILITTNILSPPVGLKIDVEPNDTICALTPVVLRAVVYDTVSGKTLDLSKDARWRVLDLNGQPSDVLKQTEGETVQFVARYAYSDVPIEVAVLYGRDTLRASLTLHIKPCEATNIFIEAQPVDIATADTATLRSPQQLAQITILADQKTGEGFAVARDASGAFVRMSNFLTTEWTLPAKDAALASAEGEINKRSHGIVTRKGVKGETVVTASEPGLVSDDANVLIDEYYIVQLQLRDSAGNVVDTIWMETDNNKEYFSWGLKSTDVDRPNDPNSWVKTNVKWDLQPDSLKVKNEEKPNAQSWILDPINPGNGILNLSKPESPKTSQLNIPVIFTPSNPSIVEIELLTKSPRYAGDTLLCEVRIKNLDGLVPGSFCFGPNGKIVDQGIYSDRLGTGGGKHPLPTLKVDGVDTLLNTLNGLTYRVNQCFQGGLDTIKVVLYYAPHNASNDSMHQISVQFGFGNKLKASTDLFVLLPNILDSIAIEDNNHLLLPPQVLTGNQSVTPYSGGYDRFGNRIGFIITNWTASGTLKPITDSATNTYVTAENSNSDRQGNVCAARYNEANKLVTACLSITIIGPAKTVSSALTRDLNGNGFLDAVEFTFDRAILPEELTVANFGNFQNGTTKFIPLSITHVDTNIIQVHFLEKDTSKFQTNWSLYYTIQNSLTVENTVQPKPTSDGAGPVITKVIRDQKDNTVKVYLSESVKNVNNSQMSINDDPSLTFNVYLRDSKDPSKFIQVPLIDPIKKFSDANTEVLKFDLPDSIDLSQAYYMNLETKPAVVQDFPRNLPHPDNIKRKVTIINPVDKMELAPNPTRPDYTITAPGVFDFRNHIEAPDKIMAGSGGLLIQVTMTRDSLISVTLNIHDQAGNLVRSIYEEDLLAYLKRTGGLAEQENASKLVLNFYWNGSTENRRSVAPGVYRVIYMAKYKKTPRNDVRFVKIAGFGRIKE